MVVSILLLLFIVAAQAQKQKYPDTLQLSYINLPNPDLMEKELPSKKADTSKVNFLERLSFSYAFNQAEKSIAYGQQGVTLARQLGFNEGIAACSQSLGWGLWGMGNYSTALQVALNALHLFEKFNDAERIGMNYILLANIYRDFGDYDRALTSAQKAAAVFEKIGISDLIGNADIGSIYDLQNRLDSAAFYIRKAVEIDRRINKGSWGWLYYLEGNIHRKLKQYDSAMVYYRTALPLVDYKDIVETYNGIALLYMETGRIDSAIFYASEVLQKWRSVSYQRGILQATTILADAYKKINQRDSVIKYQDLSIMLNHKLYNQQKERDVQNMAFNEQMRQDDIVRERIAYRNKLKIYALIGTGLVFLILALLLYRNNRNRQKAYALLQQQKDKTEQALQELKATQAQLIQREKMASLGELTAGIAHEIQNPLNFVNNFSETNTELIQEAEIEFKAGNNEEGLSLLNDIKENEVKIAVHGKRADSIVKGMLEHSRKSSGQKEPTDLNKLVDEYLRLSFHGIRAKDKSFNAVLQTNFDGTLENIAVVPQDIGRVFLNLFNNAFWAVNEKKKQVGEGYQPRIEVSTKKAGDRIQILVADNGNGITKHVMEKVFQPFFTTKPAGQGTGLGLSLSYDIVKAHGGELKVKSEEGKGATFTFTLPI
jgi:signal transduction histidine kinase